MNVSGHNIEIITRFEHAFRAADQATIDELWDPGLVDHNPSRPDSRISPRAGRCAFRTWSSYRA